jgi:alkanesulfonate monooxygenase SsuD/methylene tetrahydromethanopterin reductase-like flavin-dependent oxidoreductase (luciferase family)
MVDVISRGRLECGFVRSVPYEIAAGNSNPVRMNERLWEAHDLIVKAWTTRDGPFSFEGSFFHHRMANVWPRPYQQPHPPIWISSTSIGGAQTVGEHGYVLAVFLSGFAQTPAIFNSYRSGWRASGRPGDVPLDRLAYSALVYTGETDLEGRAGAEKLLWYFTHNKVPPYFKNPPGYLPVATNVRAMRGAGISLRPEAVSIDRLMEQGLLFCGNPDTVFDQIRRFYDRVGGFGHLLSMGQAGLLDHAETSKGIRLLAREVLPRLNVLKTPQPVAA